VLQLLPDAFELTSVTRFGHGKWHGLRPHGTQVHLCQSAKPTQSTNIANNQKVEQTIDTDLHYLLIWGGKMRTRMLCTVLAFGTVAASVIRVRRNTTTPAFTPTPAQAKWQHDEIMALVHFNMATFFHNGDPGCDSSNWQGCDPIGACNASNPASFAPTALNVSNWADSMLALGVTEAVLTGALLSLPSVRNVSSDQLNWCSSSCVQLSTDVDSTCGRVM
jgi:hypothetical protein